VAVWDEEWLVVEEHGARTVPAFKWLHGLPLNVRKQLLAIVEAVRSTGPDRWYDRTSHRSMTGDLEHVHEARDKQGEKLYRLFLRWHRDERRVVILDGRSKPNKTALAASESSASRTWPIVPTRSRLSWPRPRTSLGCSWRNDHRA
jgi:hypothetical protein